MQDRLRPLWSFNDLDASEQRFREQLERETTDEGRAEVLTQLARVEGLRDRFDEGEALVRQAESLAGTHPRVDLERGRLLNSSGSPERALPLFVAAFESAEGFVKADAAHMAAIAAPDTEQAIAWTQRGLAVGESDPDSAYWAGPLWNNLGWHHYDAGDYERALSCFEHALAARERDPSNTAALEHAREAVAEARSALGR